MKFLLTFQILAVLNSLVNSAPTTQNTTQVSTTFARCPAVTCADNSYPVYDPTGIFCPYCETVFYTPSNCEPPTCEETTCEDGYSISYDPTGCTCPTCSVISTSTEAICTRPTCPDIKCGEDYELVEDPRNCSCPTCQCKPRACPLFVVICDPNDPPPPPKPCGCPDNCIYPA